MAGSQTIGPFKPASCGACVSPSNCLGQPVGPARQRPGSDRTEADFRQPPFRTVAADLGIGAEDTLGDLGQLGGVAGDAGEPAAFAQPQQQVVGAKLPVEGAL